MVISTWLLNMQSKNPPINNRIDGNSNRPERKLTDDQVRRLREYEGRKTIDDWAEEYGVSRNAIFRAKSGRSYKNVLSSKELANGNTRL